MGVLKGFAVGLLSFLLFLSLCIFGLALMINQTILNPDFVVSEVDKLDLAPLVQEFISEQVSQEEEFVVNAVDDTVADLEPWMKEQAGTLIFASYDYLMGRSQGLNLAISLEPMKQSLRDNFRQAFLESPPPEVAGLSPAELEQYFDQYYQEFSEDMPTTLDLRESLFPAEVQATLGQVREIIDYFKLGYNGLIGFILLLILGIILINRQVRAASRSLGITFLTYGVLECAGIFVGKRFLGTELMQLDVHPSLQAWVSQLFGDLLTPLEMFSIGLAVVGLALVIVSVVYKREPSI